MKILDIALAVTATLAVVSLFAALVMWSMVADKLDERTEAAERELTALQSAQDTIEKALNDPRRRRYMYTGLTDAELRAKTEDRERMLRIYNDCHAPYTTKVCDILFAVCEVAPEYDLCVSL